MQFLILKHKEEKPIYKTRTINKLYNITLVFQILCQNKTSLI